MLYFIYYLEFNTVNFNIVIYRIFSYGKRLRKYKNSVKGAADFTV